MELRMDTRFKICREEIAWKFYGYEKNGSKYRSNEIIFPSNFEQQIRVRKIIISSTIFLSLATKTVAPCSFRSRPNRLPMLSSARAPSPWIIIIMLQWLIDCLLLYHPLSSSSYTRAPWYYEWKLNVSHNSIQLAEFTKKKHFSFRQLLFCF